MNVKVIKAEVPTDDELKTDEGKKYLLSLMLLRGVIECGKDVAMEELTEKHVLFSPIDDYAYSFIADLLLEEPFLEKWISIYDLE